MGAGLVLIVIGAILTFAVTDHVKDVNLAVVGLILMLAGAAVIYNAKRTAERQRVIIERDSLDDDIEPLHPGAPITHVVEETELEELDRHRRD
jgi:putative Mn2+ efflux pump MntP